MSEEKRAKIATMLDLTLSNMSNYTEREITEMMSIMTGAIERHAQEKKIKEQNQAKKIVQYGDLTDFLKAEGVL